MEVRKSAKMSELEVVERLAFVAASLTCILSGMSRSICSDNCVLDILYVPRSVSKFEENRNATGGGIL